MCRLRGERQKERQEPRRHEDTKVSQRTCIVGIYANKKLETIIPYTPKAVQILKADATKTLRHEGFTKRFSVL
jgi:hypothetical protein